MRKAVVIYRCRVKAIILEMQQQLSRTRQPSIIEKNKLRDWFFFRDDNLLPHPNGCPPEYPGTMWYWQVPKAQLDALVKYRMFVDKVVKKVQKELAWIMPPTTVSKVNLREWLWAKNCQCGCHSMLGACQP